MAGKLKLLLSTPHMSDESYELDYVHEAFRTNWIAPLGANVDGFENELCEKVGAGYGAALSSGTAGIHLALLAAGVGAGDVVFCQSLTFAATANPIVYTGATPVFIDSDEKTWNMDLDALEEAFRRYKPKAVIAVHLYGLSADLDPIIRLCRQNGAVLIEDAAESLGTKYKGQYTGTLGDYGVFSFNGNKIITTSGGGMVVSRDEEPIKKIRFWATQSKDPARHYQHSEIGYNYRLSNVLAGIGRGQLKVLDARVQKKQEIYALYRRELESLPDIGFMPSNDFDAPNCWLSCITLGGSVTAQDVIIALEEQRIESRPIWKPLHLQPVFSGCDMIGGSVSEWIFEHGVCLPSDTKMTTEQQLEVIAVIKGLFSR